MALTGISSKQMASKKVATNLSATQHTACQKNDFETLPKK